MIPTHRGPRARQQNCARRHTPWDAVTFGLQGVADRCLLAQRRARSGLPRSGTSSAAVQGTSHEQRGACVTWPVRRLTPCHVLYVAQLRTQWHPQPPTLIAVLPKLLCKVKNRAHKKTTRSLAKSRKPKKILKLKETRTYTHTMLTYIMFLR